MSYLILLRHGESQLNVVNRTRRVFCGQIETPLTERGREQARLAGRQLAERGELRIAWAVSSDLDRSRETLQLAAEQLPYQPEFLPPVADLNERSLGRFEGRHEDDVFAEFPHYRDDPAFNLFQNHFVQKALEGENLADVTLRAWPAVQALLSAREGDLLIVSHFNTIRCLLGAALQLPEQTVLDLRVPNAVPIVLRGRERFELVEGVG